MMEITGFILAFIIGIVMGLVGAGGSILTSGILVYIFSINPVLSASVRAFVKIGVAALS